MLNQELLRETLETANLQCWERERTATPVWAGRTTQDGAPTVYVCRDFTCSPPYHGIDEAINWLTTDPRDDKT
jgi:uncharacterized protein YyaL (SSP411 family)